MSQSGPLFHCLRQQACPLCNSDALITRTMPHSQVDMPLCGMFALWGAARLGPGLSISGAFCRTGCEPMRESRAAVNTKGYVKIMASGCRRWGLLGNFTSFSHVLRTRFAPRRFSQIHSNGEPVGGSRPLQGPFCKSAVLFR